MDRRSFVTSVTLGGLAAIPLSSSAQNPGAATPGGAKPEGDGGAAHQLPPLPYAYDALEPFLQQEILRTHHDKHHAGYVRGLNRTEQGVKAAQQAGDFTRIRSLCEALAFTYSGHLLHSLFWTNMSPDGGGVPGGSLAQQITKDFGSLDTFKAQFLAATNAVQGSGWGILAWQPLGQQLVVLQAEKHQNLAQWGVTPILVLDVWEHAYYLQYQNRRKEFTAGFFDVLNWQDVAQRLEQATS